MSVRMARMTAPAATRPETGIIQYRPKPYGHQPTRQPRGASARRHKPKPDKPSATTGPILDKCTRTPISYCHADANVSLSLQYSGTGSAHGSAAAVLLGGSVGNVRETPASRS